MKRYSLGMRQRLGVARSLLADPELLILDEPTNGLDPAGIHEFRDMIRGFVAEGRTVLLSSHLLDEVEKICDEVAIVDRGKVVVQGSIAELAAGGKQTILIATSDEEQALAILSEHRGVKSAIAEANGIRVTLSAHVEVERRTTSAGASCWRDSPFAVSSLRASRSNSVSWRSRPDWRNQHELHDRRYNCSRTRAQAKLATPTRQRRVPEAAQAARTRDLHARPHCPADDRRLHSPAQHPRRESRQAWAGGGLENFRAQWTCCPLSIVAGILVGATLGSGGPAPASSESWSSPDALASPSRHAFLPA